jgi:hypothetical protein
LDHRLARRLAQHYRKAARSLNRHRKGGHSLLRTSTSSPAFQWRDRHRSRVHIESFFHLPELGRVPDTGTNVHGNQERSHDRRRGLRKADHIHRGHQYLGIPSVYRGRGPPGAAPVSVTIRVSFSFSSGSGAVTNATALPISLAIWRLEQPPVPSPSLRPFLPEVIWP